MRVVVTGGSGFIGTHLVRLLQERRLSVGIVDIRPPQLDNVAGVEYLPVDIRQRQALRGLFKEAKVVYHLAGNPQLWTRRKGQFGQVNYCGTVHVLDEALTAGVPRLVHVSTESILTRTDQQDLIREDQDVPCREVLGPYCLSKWRAERHAWLAARRGAPVVIVNPTLPVGPGDWQRTPPTQMILDVCRGKRPAYLEGDLNLIDVRDVASGLLAAAERGRPGRRYLLSGENWSIHQLFTTVARLAGVAAPRWKVPYPLALTFAFVDEFRANLTGRPPAASVTGVRLTRRRFHFDAARSWRALGLQPRPVCQSLEELIAWFRRVGWLPQG